MQDEATDRRTDEIAISISRVVEWMAAADDERISTYMYI